MSFQDQEPLSETRFVRPPLRPERFRRDPSDTRPVVVCAGDSITHGAVSFDDVRALEAGVGALRSPTRAELRIVQNRPYCAAVMQMSESAVHGSLIPGIETTGTVSGSVTDAASTRTPYRKRRRPVVASSRYPMR